MHKHGHVPLRIPDALHPKIQHRPVGVALEQRKRRLWEIHGAQHVRVQLFQGIDVFLNPHYTRIANDDERTVTNEFECLFGIDF